MGGEEAHTDGGCDVKPGVVCACAPCGFARFARFEGCVGESVGIGLAGEWCEGVRESRPGRWMEREGWYDEIHMASAHVCMIR